MNNQLLAYQNMSARINPVQRVAKDIWNKPLLRAYTDHSIAHSERILQVLNKICVILREPLTDDEAYVLLCAVYLHDIGMQYERVLDLEFIQLVLSEEEITAARNDQAKLEAVVRDWHHLVGEFRIKHELGAKYIEEAFVDEVALVSKGHTKEDLNTYQDSTKAGRPMRLRLLAALLRLADELDLDFRRVNLGELGQSIIAERSKAHWWKCHYVESVDVDGFGRIQLTFRLSEKDPDEVRRILPTLVIDRLQRRLQQEGLKNILWTYVPLELVTTPRYDPPSSSKQPVPSEVFEIFRQEFIDLRVQQASESVELMFPVSGPGTIKIELGELPDNLIQEGLRFWQEGKKDEAIATLQRGVSRYPRHVPLVSTLADMYNRLKRWEDAKEAAQKALTIQPGNFLARLSLGAVLINQNAWHEALLHLRIAELVSYSLTLQPGDRWRMHVAMAQALSGLGDHWYARQRLDAAAEVAQSAGMEPDEVIASIVEEDLPVRTIDEGHWEITDLAWQPILGDWILEPPLQFEGRSITLEGILLAGSSSWMDYVFECEFQILNQAAGFFIRADAHATTGLMIQVFSDRLRRHQELHSNYYLHEITEVGLPTPIERHSWNKVRFEASGSKVSTYLDGQLADKWDNFAPRYASGMVGLRLYVPEFTLYRNPRITVTRRVLFA